MSTDWKELIRKSLCFPIFRNIKEIVKKIKGLFWGTLSQIKIRGLYGMFQES